MLPTDSGDWRMLILQIAIEEVPMNPFVRFMQTPAGRITRVVGGIAMIAGGRIAGGPGGVALAVAGLVPFGAGLFDVCVLAPFFRIPFSGARIREMDASSRYVS